MKDLVAYLAASLVSRPDEVAVNECARDNGVLLELRVAAEDVTLVIGKQGRTARAMRALVSAAGAKKGGRYFLKILSGDLPDGPSQDSLPDSAPQDGAPDGGSEEPRPN